MEPLNLDNVRVDEDGMIRATIDLETLTQEQHADIAEWKAAADRAAFLSQRIEKRQAILDEAVQKCSRPEDDGGVG